MATPPPDEPVRRRLIEGPRLLAGIVVAALAAGPVFFLAGSLARPFIASPGGEVFGWEEAQALPLLLAQAVRYAFLPALLPVTIGAALMAVLGAMFLKARAWLAWLAAGTIEAALLGLFVLDYPLLAVALAVTGLACAAISRAFARWPADEGAESSA